MRASFMMRCRTGGGRRRHIRHATMAIQSGGTRRRGPEGLGIEPAWSHNSPSGVYNRPPGSHGRGKNRKHAAMTSIFTDIIQDHLRLKEQNAELERYMPIERYKGVDPFENHPLFKTEEQARIEDTLDGNVSIAEPEEDLVVAHAQAYGIEPTHDEGLWSRSRDFDWGD